MNRQKIAWGAIIAGILLAAGIITKDQYCKAVPTADICVAPTPPVTTTTTVITAPPALTCANIDCRPGYVCQETAEGPVCYPPSTTTTTVATQPASCPAALPPLNVRVMQIKCADYDPNSGKCVADTTPWIRNYQPYCGIVTANPGIYSCKANPEGSGYTGCDTQFLGATCPQWQYSLDGSSGWTRCVPDSVGPAGQPASCDHFERWQEWTWADPSCQHQGCPTKPNPYTGACETAGDSIHTPIAGFTVVPHLNGWVRACDAHGTVCSDPLKVNY